MNIFSGSLIFGVFLILMGISIVLKAVFNIDVPVFKFSLALIFIYFGVQLIRGTVNHKEEKSFVFTESKSHTLKEGGELNTVFGKTYYELDEAFFQNDKFMELNVVFGQSVLKIPDQLPLRIEIQAAFSGVELPDGSVVSMGKYYYQTKSFEGSANKKNIKVNVVFASFIIRV